MPRASVFVSLAAAVLVSAAATARAQTAAAPAAPTLDPAYRLGTAARPFGWSTAVGDLNADGRPDVAIADRLGRLGGGFAYTLELSIAGVGSRSVTFDAPDSALAISLLDVDHDHNLDVVVSAPISRAVVRVWLNDGHGRFHEAASPPPETARLGDAQADTGDPSAAAAVAATEAPRQIAAPFVDSQPSPAAAAGRPRRLSSPFRNLLASSPLRPRAPPSI